MITMSQLETQVSQQQYLPLITQFYCSLPPRKDMQNISCSIREFVLLRDDVKNKEQAARTILDFFLALQSELSRNSNQDWDRAFQLSTARGYALLRMCQFPDRHARIFAFRKMMQAQRPASASCHTILLNYESNEDDINIEVEQEIKTKTYFFFKWCQFVDHSKALKEIKKRQIFNHKVSSTFNKYGIKSTYFGAWKGLWIKQKLDARNSKAIQSICKTNLLKHHFAIIQEVAAIVSVELGISQKIQEKLMVLRKREVYKRLRLNRKVVRERARKCNHKTNSMVYLFLQHLTASMRPLMNKSFQVSRRKVEKSAVIDLASKYFKYYRKISQLRNQKTLKLFYFAKKRFLSCWRTSFTKFIDFATQSQALEQLLCYGRKKNSITVLSFNKLLRREQFKKIEILIESSGANNLNSFNLIKISAKRDIEKKRNLIQKTRLQKHLRSLIQAVKTQKHFSQWKLNERQKIQELILSILRKRHLAMRLKLQGRQQYFQMLQARYDDNSKASSFRRWKKLKLCRKNEESAIEVMSKLSKNVIMMSFWNKLTCRATEKNRLYRLICGCETILKRGAFFKMSCRTLVINSEINKMRIKRQRQLMHKLFTLLRKNQTYNLTASQRILEGYARQSQRLLVKSLLQLSASKKKKEQLGGLLDKNKIISFFNQLRNYVHMRNSLVIKCRKVSKSIFISYFRRSTISGLVTEQKMGEKLQHLQIKLAELTEASFMSGLKRFVREQQSLRQKASNVEWRFWQTQIFKIKQYIGRVKKVAQTQRKITAIVHSRSAEVIRILMLNRRARVLSTALVHNRRREAVKDGVRLTKIAIKIKNQLSELSVRKQLIGKKQFLNWLRVDKNIFDEKCSNLENLRQAKVNSKLSQVLRLLSQTEGYACAKRTVMHARRRNLLSEFVATILRRKFNKIKFNTSLKFYARNIMKKAFKSLKQVHVKVKQKENMIKLDRTSSIMAQKSIEKSFKSNTLSEQIEKFNLRKSRLIR